MAKQVTYDSLEVGGDIPQLKKTPISHAQLVRYAGASGDFNPIHNDKEFAIAQGLDGTIAHGMLVMGMIGQMITNWTDPQFVKNYSIKFVGMSKPGEALTLSGKVKKKAEEDGQKIMVCTVQAEGPEGDVKAKGEIKLVCC